MEHSADVLETIRATGFEEAQGVGDLDALQPSRAIRNPLVHPRVWISEVCFDKFRAPIQAVMAQIGPSRPGPRIREGLLALRTSRESSGAHLRPLFGRFSDCKTFQFQGLDFLSNNS